MCLKKDFTFREFLTQFPDDNACISYLFVKRFGNNFCCPTCNKVTRFDRVTTRKAFQCSKCYYQVYPMAGTIFEKTRTPLHIWFYAMYEFSISKNGISAMELRARIGGTYKTALRILRQIRILAASELIELFDGSVELDETFVGGKNGNRHKDKKIPGCQGRSPKDKTPVFGIFHRETGKARAFVIPDTWRETIRPLVYKHIDRGTDVFTDEWNAYTGLENEGYGHNFVNHAAKQFGDGHNTSNRIENVWSNLKRTIKGSYISVSPKHLQSYVDEVMFRFNSRQSEEPTFFQLMALVA